MSHDVKSSWFIQPLGERPYLVPGTSPFAICVFIDFLLSTTNGSIVTPAALVQAKTVICIFVFPVM